MIWSSLSSEGKTIWIDTANATNDKGNLVWNAIRLTSTSIWNESSQTLAFASSLLPQIEPGISLFNLWHSGTSAGSLKNRLPSY